MKTQKQNKNQNKLGENEIPVIVYLWWILKATSDPNKQVEDGSISSKTDNICFR